MVRFADQRAEVGCWIHDVAGTDRGHFGEEEGFEFLLHACGHEDAGAVCANLAGAEEVGHHGAVDCVFDAGVGQDDAGRFATELHCYVFHACGGGGGDFAAG